MLDTQRYTWRHNNLINYIANSVDPKFKMFSDLQGCETAGGGTIPADLCVTNLKPTGFISKRNKSTLTSLHKLMKQDIKKSTFLSNLNSLAWYGSYKIWLTREDPTFTEPPFLVPHIN